jgi:hypothetical protein
MAANTYAKAFIPELWDASVYRTLEDNLVMKKICNLKPTKDIQKAGDTIYFSGLADPSVADYAGTLTYENLTDEQIPLLIDRQKSYAFKVTDIEQAMANVDLKGSQAERAAYVLKDTCERDVFQNVITAAGAGTVTDTSCDSATILGDVALAAQYLMENNVKQNNMWMVIPPWVMIKLKLAGVSFSINEGINGKGGLQWTKDLGFDLFVTNTIYNSAATPVSECLAGSYQSIGFAEKLMKSRAMELEDSFATGLSGLLVYGFKVLKPKELVRMTLTYTAETAI